MNRNKCLMILIAACATAAARAGDGVGAVDTMSPDAQPHSYRVQLPKWQTAELVAPELVPHRILLPETRPIAEVEENSDRLRSQAQEVGYVEPFDARQLVDWPWVTRPNGGSVSHVEFLSPGACGLRLRLENLDPGSEIQMRFANATRTSVLGPFEKPQIDEEGGWWTPTIWDESIVVELYVPEGLKPDADAPIVTKVAHLAMGGTCANTPGGATLPCHNDVVCFPTWDNNEARGVALIYFLQGASCIRCTAALLNREPGDLAPLLMTANHCVNAASDAANLEVYWFFETNSCNGTAPANPAGQPRNLGSVRLKRHAPTDWSLLGLDDPPVAGALYLGYRSSAWSNNEDGTGVHHPRGTFKRISFGDTGGTSNRTFCDANGQNCFDADVRNITYTSGTTEPGSSGSPIFDADRRVRGTLSGGDNNCPESNKYYGRLDLAFDHLKYFMDDSFIASPVFVNGGVAGDPGNNGDTERGTLLQPFNTVEEATHAVRSGDEVHIAPGSYNERFSIWRPVTLRRNGSSGSVRIGD